MFHVGDVLVFPKGLCWSFPASAKLIAGIVREPKRQIKLKYRLLTIFPQPGVWAPIRRCKSDVVSAREWGGVLPPGVIDKGYTSCLDYTCVCVFVCV